MKAAMKMVKKGGKSVPAFAADGVFVVTAVFSLLPGLALRYAATPFLVMPAPALVERKLPLLTEVLMPMPLALAIMACSPSQD